MPEVAIIAGEASGDASGAALMKEILDRRPDVSIWGAGGEQMQNAGAQILTDLSIGGAIGIAQSLAIVPRIAGRYLMLRQAILKKRPDLLILIDFGAFNVRIGQVARKSGLKTLYYFPPSSWRKTIRSAARIKACSDSVITPFPWSEAILRKSGVNASFVGHPLLDAAKASMTRNEFCKSLVIKPESRIIGLLPGSRGHEIKHNLPALLDSVRMISQKNPELQYVVAAGPNGSAKKIRSILQQSDVKVAVAEGVTYDVMAHSELLLTCSGTATLEATIIGTPMVIFYRGSSIMRLEYLLRRASVLEMFIGMPNIIAEKMVCPELVAGAATPKAITEAALGILEDPMRAKQMKEDLAVVKSVLGEPGAVSRAASLVLDAIDK